MFWGHVLIGPLSALPVVPERRHCHAQIAVSASHLFGNGEGGRGDTGEAFHGDDVSFRDQHLTIGHRKEFLEDQVGILQSGM